MPNEEKKIGVFWGRRKRGECEERSRARKVGGEGKEEGDIKIRYMQSGLSNPSLLCLSVSLLQTIPSPRKAPTPVTHLPSQFFLFFSFLSLLSNNIGYQRCLKWKSLNENGSGKYGGREEGKKLWMISMI